MRLRLLRRALLCGALALVGLVVAPAPPASAEVCVQAGASVEGSDPGYQGFCDPIQPWPFFGVRCVEHETDWGNVRVKERVCVPTLI